MLQISGIMNQNEMEATVKRRVKNELSLKAKFDGWWITRVVTSANNVSCQH